MAIGLRTCKPCDDFTDSACALPTEHCHKPEEGWSIHLVAREAIELPNWLERLAGQNPVHLYLSLRDPEGNELTQIHGLPMDNRTGEPSITGEYFDDIRVVTQNRMNPARSVSDIKLWEGNQLDFMKKVGNALYAGKEINAQDYSYLPYVPFIQSLNSNSIAREMVNAMNLPMPEEIKGHWWQDSDKIWAPGSTATIFNQMVDAEAVFDSAQSIEEVFSMGFDRLRDSMTIDRVVADLKDEKRAPVLASNGPVPAAVPA